VSGGRKVFAYWCGCFGVVGLWVRWRFRGVISVLLGLWGRGFGGRHSCAVWEVGGVAVVVGVVCTGGWAGGASVGLKSRAGLFFEIALVLLGEGFLGVKGGSFGCGGVLDWGVKDYRGDGV